MFSRLKKLFNKIIHSHALNSPVKSLAVAIFACAANMFMSTPYPWLTATITSIPILLSDYADFRQIYLKNQQRGTDTYSRYFCTKHHKAINYTVGIISFSILATFFLLTAFPNLSNTMSSSAFSSSISTSNSHANSIIKFLLSSLKTPSNIVVLFATIIPPVYRMIHNHYIRRELEDTEKMRTAEQVTDELAPDAHPELNLMSIVEVQEAQPKESTEPERVVESTPYPFFQQLRNFSLFSRVTHSHGSIVAQPRQNTDIPSRSHTLTNL